MVKEMKIILGASPRIIALILVLSVCIFVVDIFTPLGVAGGVPYVAVVLVSLWLPHRTFTIFIALLCSFLTVLGYFVSPSGGELWKVLANRFIALFAIWVTAFLGMARSRVKEALEIAHNNLATKAADLKEANEELSQYSYVVSHDLKAPLRAIHNYADFLLDDLEPTLEGEQKTYLENLNKAVRQSQELINDLLELTQIGSKNDKIEAIDMGEFFKDLLESLDLSPDVEVKMGKDWPVIEAVPTLLHQVFQNLLVNAFKFNLSKTKHIEIGWLPAGNRYCELFVRDNGIGIEHVYYDQIFRVFQRLHASETFEGTGLGLAIVKKASYRLKGSVRVESKPGEGSTFFVTLPKKQKEEKYE